MAMPDPNNYPTMTEWQKAMQEWYAVRRDDRMRGIIPTIEVRETLLRPPVRLPVPSGDDLALVQMIKEDLKEAELLGWNVSVISMDTNLRLWLIQQQPPSLVSGRGSLTFYLFGRELMDAGVGDAQPYHLLGNHNEHGICFTCWQNGDEQ